MHRVYRGFTLVELTVVVSIIIILTGMTMANVAKSRAQAKLSACVQNLKTIATALEMCQVDHPEYFRGRHNCVYVINEDCVLVKEGYLKTIPRCPNGAEYSYKVGHSIEGEVYENYWHIAHQTKNNHKGCGVKDYYPYYRCDRGICYSDFTE